MTFTLKSQGNIYNLMRQCGYHPHKTGEEKPGDLAFVRRLGVSNYPRFHIYLKVSRETSQRGSGQVLAISLHLDQKKPVYEGATAHSGEYEGKLVEKEAERIKKIIAGP